MITLEAADHIRDFRIGSLTGMPKMIIVTLPGYVRNTAKDAHVSDALSEDAVNGLVLGFFLNSDAGMPLISINASR